MNLGAPGAAVLSRASHAVLKLSRPTKRIVMMAADAMMLPVALLLAIFLKFDKFIEPEHIESLLLGAFVCGLGAFSLLGLYRAVIRFMGVRAIGRMVVPVLTGALDLPGLLAPVVCSAMRAQMVGRACQRKATRAAASGL